MSVLGWSGHKLRKKLLVPRSYHVSQMLQRDAITSFYTWRNHLHLISNDSIYLGVVHMIFWPFVSFDDHHSIEDCTKDLTVHCQVELLAPFWGLRCIQNLHSCSNENFCKTEHFHCSCRCSFCTTTPPQTWWYNPVRPTCGDTALCTFTKKNTVLHSRVKNLNVCCTGGYCQNVCCAGEYCWNVFCQMYVKFMLYTGWY